MYGLRKPCVGEPRLQPLRVLAGQGKVGTAELVSSCFLDWIDPALMDALIKTLFAKNVKGFYYTGAMWLL